MNSQEEKLTTQESLDIITEMISQAKGNVQENSFYFLFWGLVTVIANLGVFTLIQLEYQNPYSMWLIAVPAWLYTLYQGFRRGKTRRVTSHLDRISSWLWISFGIVVLSLIVFGKAVNYQLNPLILIVTAIPTLLSGVIIKFRPLIFGGIVFWIVGMISFSVDYSWQCLLGAVAVTLGYLIPGWMLRHKQVH